MCLRWTAESLNWRDLVVLLGGRHCEVEREMQRNGGLQSIVWIYVSSSGAGNMRDSSEIQTKKWFQTLKPISGIHFTSIQQWHFRIPLNTFCFFSFLFFLSASTIISLSPTLSRNHSILRHQLLHQVKSSNHSIAFDFWSRFIHEKWTGVAQKPGTIVFHPPLGCSFLPTFGSEPSKFIQDELHGEMLQSRVLKGSNWERFNLRWPPASRRLLKSMKFFLFPKKYHQNLKQKRKTSSMSRQLFGYHQSYSHFFFILNFFQFQQIHLFPFRAHFFIILRPFLLDCNRGSCSASHLRSLPDESDAPECRNPKKVSIFSFFISSLCLRGPANSQELQENRYLCGIFSAVDQTTKKWMVKRWAWRMRPSLCREYNVVEKTAVEGHQEANRNNKTVFGFLFFIYLNFKSKLQLSLRNMFVQRRNRNK